MNYNTQLILHDDYAPQKMIEDCLEQARKIVTSFDSEKSRQGMISDMKYWKVWGEVNNFNFNYGVNKEQLITFIIQHADEMPADIDYKLMKTGIKLKPGINKMATIKRRIASLSTFSNIQGLQNFCNDKDVKFLMKKLTNRHGCSQRWGDAITLDILNKMLETCGDSNNFYDLRDKALLLFAFSSGGRRKSEICEATMSLLSRLPDGNFMYNLKKSKTNRDGKDEIKPIFGRAAIALQHYLSELNIKEGYIFRSISKWGYIGEKISSAQIYNIIKNRARLAGLDENRYTPHSLRSGFVTEGGKRGLPIFDLMNLTGHRRFEEIRNYYQSGNVYNNSASFLAG